MSWIDFVPYLIGILILLASLFAAYEKRPSRKDKFVFNWRKAVIALALAVLGGIATYSAQNAAVASRVQTQALISGVDELKGKVGNPVALQRMYESAFNARQQALKGVPSELGARIDVALKIEGQNRNDQAEVERVLREEVGSKNVTAYAKLIATIETKLTELERLGKVRGLKNLNRPTHLVSPDYNCFEVHLYSGTIGKTSEFLVVMGPAVIRNASVIPLMLQLGPATFQIGKEGELTCQAIDIPEWGMRRTVNLDSPEDLAGIIDTIFVAMAVEAMRTETGLKNP